jgi:UDP-glucuronate 4-epimerase
VQLTVFIEAIEKALGQTAKKNFMDMQAGDVPATWADGSLLKTLTGYTPQTDVETGVKAFVDWYRGYYEI